MSSVPFIVIGNPENRRVTLFAAALEELGLPPPEVVSWISILRDDPLRALTELSADRALVRIDSFGENAEVEAELLRLGLDDARQAGASTILFEDAQSAVADRGRIVCPRQAHFGFLRALASLERTFAERPRWSILNPPSAIAELFDKRKTSALYASRGITVPRTLLGIETFDALRARMRDEAIHTVYVKISCSSSASGLAIYHLSKHGEHATTTVELEGDRFYNSLRLRRIQQPRELETLFEFLLREGAQIEVSVPKARLDGYFFDLRVLVIDRDPAFTVVRQSRHPITNLHLGGRRGELARLRDCIPASTLEAVNTAATMVFDAHATLHVGADILLEEGTFQPHVVEANAFGDLLPNLKKDGRSVYAHEIQAALARYMRAE